MFRELLWKLGEIISCFYGPILILTALLFGLTHYLFFLILTAIYMLIFIQKWIHVGGNPLSSLLSIAIFEKTPKLKIELFNGQTAELYLNKDPNAPCLIFLHGGGFISGKNDQYSKLNNIWSSLGFHILQMNYDYIPNSDLDACTAKLKENVNLFLNYKTENFQPKEYFIGGRSAGAYLALNLSTQIESTKLTKVISFYTPSDIQMWKSEFFPRLFLPLDKIYDLFFKNQKNEINLLKNNSFSSNRKYILITGDNDLIVPAHHSIHLHQHLINLQCQSELYILKTESHGFECNSQSFAGQKVLQILKQQLAAAYY